MSRVLKTTLKSGALAEDLLIRADENAIEIRTSHALLMQMVMTDDGQFVIMDLTGPFDVPEEEVSPEPEWESEV